MALMNTIPTNDEVTSPEVVTAADVKKPRNGRLAKKRPTKKTAPAGTTVGPSKSDEPNLSVTKKQKVTETKASAVLKKLRSAKGVTIVMLMEATGWQAHSVRGFLSAVVKKKLGLNLVSEAGKDGVRRYRIHEDGKAG